MQHVLAHGDRRKLSDTLENDPELKTRTSDSEAREMLENTIGGPDAIDVLRMKMMHKPLVNRGARSYLELTLYRRLRKQFAATGGVKAELG